MPVQSDRSRNKSLGGLVSVLKNVPSLGQLISEGQASDERIRANEQVIRPTVDAPAVTARILGHLNRPQPSLSLYTRSVMALIIRYLPSLPRPFQRLTPRSD